MNKEKVAVLADSGGDIAPDFVERYGIYVLPLHIMYPEKDYLDGVDIDPMMVYERFPEEYPSTSTPSLAEVQDMFQRIKDDGFEKVIAVTISSGLSGTFNTIRLAASEETDLDVFVFDSKNISVASGMWAIWAAVKLEEGRSFEQITKGMTDKVYDCKVMFYMDTLQYLKRGGRIGNVTSIVGEALKLKPIISCDRNGIYYTVALIRGAKSGKNKLLKEMLKFCQGHSAWVIIGTGGAEEEGKNMLALVDSKMEDKKILFTKQITATLALNTGPGLVGIAALLDP